MKKVFYLALILCVFLFASQVSADVLMAWDFADSAGNETTATALTIATNISDQSPSGIISRGTGLNAAENAGRFNANNWGQNDLNTTITDNDYMEWTINPSAGYQITLTSIGFNWQRSATGPPNITLRSNLDGFSSDAGALTGLGETNTELNFNLTGFTNIASAVTFRLYGFGATGSTGSGGFEGTGDDLIINGTVDELPPLPVELSYFYANIEGENINLHWGTQSEIANAGFVIYRDNQPISSIIPGAGTTTTPHDYSYVDKNVEEGVTYRYKIADIEEETGIQNFSAEIAVMAGYGMVTPETPGILPETFVLHDNYPNPFNPTTFIDFEISQTFPVDILIYDTAGKLVRTLTSGVTWKPGRYTLVWDGTDNSGSSLGSGVYFLRMHGGEIFIETKRMVLAK